VVVEFICHREGGVKVTTRGGWRLLFSGAGEGFWRMSEREGGCDEDGSTGSPNKWDSRSEGDTSDDCDTMGMDSGFDADDEYGQAGFEEASALQDESRTL
jgi:hypothetical protein